MAALALPRGGQAATLPGAMRDNPQLRRRLRARILADPRVLGRADFRRCLATLGLSQLGCARRMAVDPRTVRRWALGEAPVPAPVALLLACWLERAPEKVHRGR